MKLNIASTIGYSCFNFEYHSIKTEPNLNNCVICYFLSITFLQRQSLHFFCKAKRTILQDILATTAVTETGSSGFKWSKTDTEGSWENITITSFVWIVCIFRKRSQAFMTFLTTSTITSLCICNMQYASGHVHILKILKKSAVTIITLHLLISMLTWFSYTKVVGIWCGASSLKNYSWKLFGLQSI